MSNRAEQIVDCIVILTRDKGYPPTIREIGKAVGLRSSSTVHAHLERLEHTGRIRRDPASPRAIEVIETQQVRKVDAAEIERLIADLDNQKTKAEQRGDLTGALALEYSVTRLKKVLA